MRAIFLMLLLGVGVASQWNGVPVASGGASVSERASAEVAALTLCAAEFPAPDVAPEYSPSAADLPDNAKADAAEGAAVELQATPALSDTGPKRLNELHYAAILARQWNGQTEVRLADNTRCDIVTGTHAIEVDWAEKWSEGIGQSLFYGLMLGKRPGLILLVDDPAADQRFINRAQRVCAERKIWLTTANTNDLDKITGSRSRLPITLAVIRSSIVPAARGEAVPSKDCGCDPCNCKGLCDCKAVVTLVAQPCPGGRCPVPRARGIEYRPAPVAAYVAPVRRYVVRPAARLVREARPVRRVLRAVDRLQPVRRLLRAADRVRPVRRVARFVFRGRARRCR